jgi:hypothetical protein
MELKVLCDCGQKFKFDVEPANGRMPFAINCPTCNEDNTAKANSLIAENLPVAAPPPPPIAPPFNASVPGGLRINRMEPAALATATMPPPVPPVASPGYPLLPATAVAGKPKVVREFNLGMGIVGALLGAVLGAGLMYGFFTLANFRFPLMGTCVGALTGLGARILYKGTDSTLGVIAAVIAVLATCGTLYLMYGEVSGIFIISIGVSGYFAYRVAS